MADCKFAHSVGDINEDGMDEHVCLMKSKIEYWPEGMLIPLGDIHFVGMGECCYCQIHIRN